MGLAQQVLMANNTKYGCETPDWLSANFCIYTFFYAHHCRCVCVCMGGRGGGGGAWGGAEGV